MKVSSIVEAVLKNNPHTRNSDTELILEVFKSYGLRLTPEQTQKFREAPTTETIRRIRQKIQEKGLYPASENVKRVRRTKSMIVEQNAPSASPQTMGNILEASPKPVRKRSLFNPWMNS